MEPANGATLLIANRSAAFYWEARLQANGTYGRPTGPVHVTEGELWVFYGGTSPKKVAMTPDAANPFDEAVKHIGSVHAGAPVKIPLARFCFAGVMLPHDAKSPFRWERPFRDLQDFWMREHPNLYGQGSSGLMSNSVFVAHIPDPKLKP